MNEVVFEGRGIDEEIKNEIEKIKIGAEDVMPLAKSDQQCLEEKREKTPQEMKIFYRYFDLFEAPLTEKENTLAEE